MVDKVAERIASLAEIRSDRAKFYGNSPDIKGDVMASLFPKGVILKTAGQQARFSIVSFIVSKLVRYCNNFEAGGHEDSLNDIAVYSQILADMDERK